jgi:hypothetical protein
LSAGTLTPRQAATTAPTVGRTTKQAWTTVRRPGRIRRRGRGATASHLDTYAVSYTGQLKRGPSGHT